MSYLPLIPNSYAESDRTLPESIPSSADRITAGESPFATSELASFRERMREFARTCIAPYATEWDEAGTFPLDLYRQAAHAGVIGAGFDPAYGGTGGDIRHTLIVKEELARFGSGGVRVGLTTHSIALPPLLALGNETLKRRIAPAVLRGEKLMALAVSEPSGGSDVAGIQTHAVEDGDHFVVNGRKLFISTGIRADYYTLAVRTGGPGKAGLSLLLVERGTPGFLQHPLKKMGWWSSDTAELVFDNCRVPRSNLIGEEGQGFVGLMKNFNQERLGNTAIVLGASKACYDEAVHWARNRLVFGEALIGKQVTRHKLVDMATQIQAVDTQLSLLAWRFSRGQADAAQIAMTKNIATETYERCANEAVQIHGGHGVLRHNRVDRLFRESKMLSIGGGAAEILKDLAARQLGL
ncbi:acyl-CoA dehydrogenase family protein [Rhodoferax sediminis]|uniref:Acyl-CoA dehydrogenase n=1 Tax=Rhodoferax sediminis TaxID=2509614 RepID=A0A515DDK5_9BURK|nr:acyl-CoA dehydrogenase family protein [Rhodoferax sediminis]QDL38511.1 acyl-CoA dehydrogenase [Rhodoferax sediminis]